MPAEITMPQLSDTMTEGTIVRWLKQEGEKVKQGEVIAEIETDKATMEMEAFEGGTLAVVAAAVGEKVAVGQAIGYLATGSETPEQVRKQVASGGGKAPDAAKLPAKPLPAGGDASSPAPKSPKTELPASTSAEPVTSPGDESMKTANPDGGRATMEEATSGEIHDLGDTLHGATRQDISTEPPTGGDGDTVRVFASPLARKVAAEKGIDLSTIQGSGPGGRIIRIDVESAPAGGEPTASSPTSVATGSAGSTTGDAAPGSAKSATPLFAPAPIGNGASEVIPLSKMRQTIAVRLQQAKQQIPHIYLSVDIDMEAVMAVRERMNKSLEPQKVRLSVGDFIAKAVSVALVRHPGLNAHFDEKNTRIIRFGDVHLGNAVALPDGLIVPVLRNVQAMGLTQIRQRSVDLFDRAKAQRLKREEMSGATFTITNLGMFGIGQFSAIINPPEVAILAVSAATPRVVARDGQPVVRSTMTVTLSTDHRAVDGASGAAFLKTLRELLEEPALMLA